MGEVRLATMERFLLDYAGGVRDGRYVAAELPRLPFGDGAFDLALCSHLVFLYAEQLSLAFHVESVIEMARTAREVRIFPLLALGNIRRRTSRRCARNWRGADTCTRYESAVRISKGRRRDAGGAAAARRRGKSVRDVTPDNVGDA
jgi:hypothetical protein